MYCQLGDILFEGLKGVEAWSVEGNEASYGEHALIDGKPRLQKTGDTLQELTLTIRLHARFCNPKQELSKLDKAKTDGEILPLLMGDGSYVSDYVIISAPYTVDHALADGTIVQATVTLSLKEFVPYSKEEQQQQTARKNAFATGDKKPVMTDRPNHPQRLFITQAFRRTNMQNAFLLRQRLRIQSARYSNLILHNTLK